MRSARGLASVLAVCASGGAFAGDAPIAGRLDPATMTFTALARSPDEAAAGDSEAAPKIVRGELTLKALVTIETSVPADAQFRVSASMSGGSNYTTSPTAGADYAAAGAFGVAKRKGSQVIATVVIPYNLQINASSETLLFNMYLSSGEEGTPSLNFSRRIPIPKNGSKTEIELPGAM